MTAGKRIAVAVAIVLAANLVVALIATQLQSPTGPRSSSYATSPSGVAAYASLLEEFGFDTNRYRRPLGDEPLDPRTTVVLLEPPELPPDGARVLKDFVAAGGRLVAGGSFPTWLEDVVGDVPRWGSEGPTEAPFVAGPPVRLSGEGAWTDVDHGDVAVGHSDAAVVVKLPAGRGTALVLADVSPLQNRWLDRGGNAALGLYLVGEPPRGVVFVESVHGYGLGEGLAALPARWRWTFAGLAVAALLWLWARAMRLGPPEQKARVLPPPRTAYVHALAATLARTETRRRGNP